MDQTVNTNTVTTTTIIHRWAYAFALILALSSCATMNKQDCLQGNWQDAGYNDATSGRTTSRFPSHVKSCAKHGVASNEPVYLTGYQLGVHDYCQPENGINQGTRNRDYRGICPIELESEFLQQYVLGLQFVRRDLTREYWHYDHRLSDARFRRARLTDGQSEEKINRRIDRLKNKLDSLRTERYEVNRKIYRWRTRIISAQK